MKKRYNQVYQFKITLDNIKPQVWRRIQVPESYTFWDLHVAIQDAFGWYDYHLHEFCLHNFFDPERINIGIPDQEFGRSILSGWEQNIADYFTLEKCRAKYTYDFGDNWEHTIVLEKILPREKGVKYPRLLKGKRACPPEDCGGPLGYERFLKIINNPKYEEHKEMLDWIGGKFDPEYFDPEDVIFDNPAKRLKLAFEGKA